MIDVAGMLEQTISSTISGLIVNSPWFILFYICAKMITRELRNLGKEVPEWIDRWEKAKMRALTVQNALSKRIK